MSFLACTDDSVIVSKVYEAEAAVGVAGDDNSTTTTTSTSTSNSTIVRIRKATVADAEALMRFGYKAFDDTFSGHPKNHPDDMKLYMDEAFTVEQFAKEIGNVVDGDNDGRDGHHCTNNNNSERIPRNIFLMAEEFPYTPPVAATSCDGEVAATPSSSTTTAQQQPTIVAYAKLCENALEEDVKVTISPKTGEQQRVLELCRLYVGKDFVGKRGLGSLMMTACEKVAREECQSEVMWLGVWEYNFIAQRFYEQKHGFRFVGKHVFQLGNDPQIDLIMQKDL